MSQAASVSPAGSFRGYSLRIWLVRNKEKLKGLLSLGFGILTALVPAITNPILKGAAGAAVTFVSALALDALDFWLTDVPFPTDPAIAQIPALPAGWKGPDVPA